MDHPAMNPAAPHHLPSFVTGPGQSDWLMTVMLVFLLVAVVSVGLIYLKLHALPEHMAYSTSPGPTGPWTYGGEIMNSVNGHAFTNHGGIIDFKGHSYFFYHTQELPGGGGYKRSVAIEEFTYGQNGSIPTIQKTSAGVTESVAPLNPYLRVEGETMAWAWRLLARATAWLKTRCVSRREGACSLPTRSPMRTA